MDFLDSKKHVFWHWRNRLALLRVIISFLIIEIPNPVYKASLTQKSQHWPVTTRATQRAVFVIEVITTSLKKVRRVFQMMPVKDEVEKTGMGNKNHRLTQSERRYIATSGEADAKKTLNRLRLEQLEFCVKNWSRFQ